MPIYSYYCVCGVDYKIERSIHESETNPTCVCGQVMKRSYGVQSIIFKGSGFYKTDKNG